MCRPRVTSDEQGHAIPSTSLRDGEHSRTVACPYGFDGSPGLVGPPVGASVSPSGDGSSDRRTPHEGKVAQGPRSGPAGFQARGTYWPRADTHNPDYPFWPRENAARPGRTAGPESGSCATHLWRRKVAATSPVAGGPNICVARRKSSATLTPTLLYVEMAMGGNRE
jgi:hypothetical protein